MSRAGGLWSEALEPKTCSRKATTATQPIRARFLTPSGIKYTAPPVLRSYGKPAEEVRAFSLGVDGDASVVGSYGGYRMVPFGGDPGNEELLSVAEAVGASGD